MLKNAQKCSCKENCKYLFDTGERKFVMDCSRMGSELSKINHAGNKSNCQFRCLRVKGEWRVGIYALKPIQKGTELLVDYGEDYIWD